MAGFQAAGDSQQRVGQVRGTGGAAELIVHDAQFVAFGYQAHHGFDEIDTVGAVEPGRPDNEVRSPGAAYGGFAFALLRPRRRAASPDPPHGRAYPCDRRRRSRSKCG